MESINSLVIDPATRIYHGQTVQGHIQVTSEAVNAAMKRYQDSGLNFEQARQIAWNADNWTIDMDGCDLVSP